MSRLYYAARPLCAVLVFLTTRCRVLGKDNIPAKGPVIIVSNHLNNADPPLIGAAVWPREIAFMAKEELFRNPALRFLIYALGAFPVNRRRYDRESLRRAGEVLRRGLLLGMFPEGSRSQNGGLQPAMPGPALIARHFKSPILPVGIYGTESMKGPFWILKRPEVTVNIGPAFELPPTSEQPAKEELKKATDTIMKRIAALLPEQYRGVYRAETGEGS